MMAFGDFLRRAMQRLDWYWRRWIQRDAISIARHEWRIAKGDATLRLSYLLGPHSVVMDVGGFEGACAAEISRLYGARLLVFEAVPEQIERLRCRFSDSPNVKVFPYGLSHVTQTARITVDGPSSSQFRGNGPVVAAQFRCVGDVLEDENLDDIDLIKINIEGGEYPLLEYMLDKDLVQRFKNLQIQFHEFIEDAEERRQNIRKKLMQTHELTYDYLFMWENWRRRDLQIVGNKSASHRTSGQ